MVPNHWASNSALHMHLIFKPSLWLSFDFMKLNAEKYWNADTVQLIEVVSEMNENFIL